jgi:hypothetical protein
MLPGRSQKCFQPGNYTAAGSSRVYIHRPINENRIGSYLDKNLRVATFAGGCFWCMQPPFQQIEGVNGAVAEYSDRTKPKSQL